MYQVENGFKLPNGGQWDPEYYQELMEGRIISSKAAEDIFKLLRSEDVLPEMKYYDWAMLCIGYCFAKGSAYNKDQLEHNNYAKGMEIPSFKTCFQNHARFWLVMLSDALFELYPRKTLTKTDLYRYIQDLWHNGAMFLNKLWQHCKDNNPNSHLMARQMFMSELSQIASNNVKQFQTALSQPANLRQKTEQVELGNAGQNRTTELLHTLQDECNVPVRSLTFESKGLRYDFYRVCLESFFDMGKVEKPLRSALGLSDSGVRISRCTDGTTHNYLIKLLRPENTWRTLDQEDFAQALQKYHHNFTLPICVGADENCQAVFRDLKSAPHLLIGGTSGSGKSVLMRYVLSSLYKLTPQENFEVAILDTAAFQEFQNYSNIWHQDIVHDRNEMRDALDEIGEEVQRRIELLRQYNVTDINGIPSDSRPKYLVVLMDELAALLDQDKSAETPLIKILQEGRKAGVHIIAATQEPDSQTFSPRLRSNLGSRIALRVVKPGSSKMILDEPGAEKLIGKGDHLVKWDGQTSIFLHGYMI